MDVECLLHSHVFWAWVEKTIEEERALGCTNIDAARNYLVRSLLHSMPVAGRC